MIECLVDEAHEHNVQSSLRSESLESLAGVGHYIVAKQIYGTE